MSPSKRTRDSDEEDFLSENESSSRPSNLKKRARMSTPEGKKYQKQTWLFSDNSLFIFYENL